MNINNDSNNYSSNNDENDRVNEEREESDRRLKMCGLFAATFLGYILIILLLFTGLIWQTGYATETRGQLNVSCTVIRKDQPQKTTVIEVNKDNNNNKTIEYYY